MDAAAADLVRAEQNVVGAAGRAPGDAGERHAFEVGAGGREHDVDIFGERVGGADATAQPIARTSRT